MSRRFRLRRPGQLQEIMDHTGDGRSFSVRDLADRAGCSSGLVGGLLSGRQKTTDVDVAISITEALGVKLLVLFDPPTSIDRDDPTTDHQPKE